MFSRDFQVQPGKISADPMQNLMTTTRAIAEAMIEKPEEDDKHRMNKRVENAMKIVGAMNELATYDKPVKGDGDLLMCSKCQEIKTDRWFPDQIPITDSVIFRTLGQPKRDTGPICMRCAVLRLFASLYSYADTRRSTLPPAAQLTFQIKIVQETCRIAEMVQVQAAGRKAWLEVTMQGKYDELAQGLRGIGEAEQELAEFAGTKRKMLITGITAEVAMLANKRQRRNADSPSTGSDDEQEDRLPGERTAMPSKEQTILQREADYLKMWIKDAEKSIQFKKIESEPDTVRRAAAAHSPRRSETSWTNQLTIGLALVNQCATHAQGVYQKAEDARALPYTHHALNVNLQNHFEKVTKVMTEVRDFLLTGAQPAPSASSGHTNEQPARDVSGDEHCHRYWMESMQQFAQINGVKRRREGSEMPPTAGTGQPELSEEEAKADRWNRSCSADDPWAKYAKKSPTEQQPKNAPSSTMQWLDDGKKMSPPQE